MKTILHKCPNPECAERHAICIMEGVVKREIGVMCGYAGKPKFFKIDEPIDEADVDGVPVYYTPAAKKKALTKDNLQFVMMIPKDGEKVERNVDLNQQDVIQISRDKIDRALTLMKQCEDKIAKLEEERRKHQAEAQRLSCELSKIETKPLFEEITP